MFIVFSLLFLCLIKFIIFHMKCKYIILPGVSYGTSNSFRLQKETSCLQVNK